MKGQRNQVRGLKSEKVIKISAVSGWLIQLLIEALTFVCVWKLNILPDQYLLAFGGVLAVLLGIVGCLVLIRTRKSSVTGLNIRRMIALLLALVMILVCGVAAAAVSKAYTTMEAMGNTTLKTTSMMVYVRSDDPAQSIEDAADYRFAVMQDHDTEKTQQAVAAIEQQLGKKIQVIALDGAAQMIESLLNHSVDAAIVSDAYVNILDENGVFENLTQLIRQIHAVSVTEQVSVTPPQENPEATEPDATRENSNEITVKVQDVTTRPFIVYISGSDTRSQYLEDRNSDVNILGVVNPVSKQVLLVNTPRDYYIPNPEGNGNLDKLTHLGCFGVDCSMQGLADLYQEQIDYYAQINFSGFETLIDAVGGIVVESDVSFMAHDVYIQAGENYLDGASALKFARERYRLAEGDNARGRNQMKVIKAVIDELTSSSVIKNYSQILDSLEGMFKTDMTKQEMTKLVKMQLADNAKWNVQTYAVVGTGGSEITYSIPGVYVSVMHPNQASVEYGAELIDRVIAGETLTEADVKFPQE